MSCMFVKFSAYIDQDTTVANTEKQSFDGGSGNKLIFLWLYGYRFVIIF